MSEPLNEPMPCSPEEMMDSVVKQRSDKEAWNGQRHSTLSSDRRNC